MSERKILVYKSDAYQTSEPVGLPQNDFKKYILISNLAFK